MVTLLLLLLVQDEPLDQGLKYLKSAQKENGSFAPNKFGPWYSRGITGMCLLPLLNAGEDDAAKKGLDWLAKNTRVKNMYSHGYAALALCEGAIRWEKYKDDAKSAVQTIVRNQNKNGGWGYAASPASSRTESCMNGLMLHVMYSARKAEIDVPQGTIDKALKFLRNQVRKNGSSNNESMYPSPSYGATGIAVAGLKQWGEKDLKKSMEYLGKQSVDRITDNLRGKPFRGYARGYYHYELAGHALALYYSDDLKEWLPKVRKKLASKIAEDGSWDGWYGKPYGTALMCLILQLDRSPRLSFLKKRKTY